MLFAFAALAGSLASGINISHSVCAMQEKVCNAKKSLKQFNLAMSDADKLLDIEQVELRQDLANQVQGLATLHQDLITENSTFKQNYQNFLIGGIIFVMIVIFALAVRRFIFPKGGT